MNKVIVGGILVTMMGGTPTVTYFLTKETSKNDDQNLAEVNTKVASGEDCVPETNKKTCTKPNPSVEEGVGVPKPREEA